MTATEVFHSHATAFEGDDEQGRGAFTVALDAVEFPGAVEDKVALLQTEDIALAMAVDATPCHVNQLPEVVGFTRVAEICGQIKAEDGYDIGDVEGGCGI